MTRLWQTAARRRRLGVARRRPRTVREHRFGVSGRRVRRARCRSDADPVQRSGRASGDREAARLPADKLFRVRTSTTASGDLLASTSLNEAADTRRPRRACRGAPAPAARRWRLVARRIGRAGGGTEPPRRFNRRDKRDHALAAKSDGYATGLIVYTLRQAGVSGRAPIDQERLAMAEGSPAAGSRRRSGMARLARPLAQLRSRARRFERRTVAAGCSCPTPPRRSRRWDCSRRNERRKALPLRSLKRTGGHCSFLAGVL